MNLLDLVATLSLDKSKYDDGLGDAEKSASSFGSKLTSGLKTAGAVATGAIVAVGATAGAVGKAFTDSAGAVASYGDEIDKASQKVGISAQAYQEWDAILQHSGASASALRPAMKTLQTQAEKGSEAFEKLGISQEQVASMSREELFNATIAGLQGMTDESDRAILAQELLGKSAMEMGALLNTSAEDTEAMRKRVHELGGVMSDEAVKAAAAYQDSLQDMTTAFSGLKRNMMSEFLPSMVTVMDGLGNIFSGNPNEGLGQIKEGISKFSERLTEVIPKVISIASEIITALAQAIIENLPIVFQAGVSALTELLKGLTENQGQMADSARNVLTALVTAITDNLPAIFDTAVDILFALADGIIDSLPELIPAVVEVILAIVDKLTDPDTLMRLIDAAFQLIEAIAEGLIEAIPILIEKAPIIISNLIEALVRLYPRVVESGVQLIAQLATGIVKGISSAVKAVVNVFNSIRDAFKGRIKEALNWGRDLINNFVNGIKEGFGKVRDAMVSLGDLVSSFIHFSEPDVGPLSDFSTYAPDMMKTFAEGIKANENVVRRQMEKSFDFSDAMNLNPNAGMLAGDMLAGVPMHAVGNLSNNRNPSSITVILELDRQVLGKVVYKLNNEEVQRVGVKLAGGYGL